MINITDAYFAPAREKLRILDNLRELTTDFNISNYSNQINELFFIFQCFPSTSLRKVTEFKRLRRKTQTLELYLILDYERIMQGTAPENLQHIKEVFLKGCETFLKPLKGFKWEEFETKIKELL